MHSINLDTPIARMTLERATRPFQIYFFLFMASLGSCLFIIGMITGGLDWLEHTTLPDSTLMLFTGIGAFAFFFPYFLCLYCCRILLRAVCELERKVESLSHDT
jgi:hypothetical protein